MRGSAVHTRVQPEGIRTACLHSILSSVFSTLRVSGVFLHSPRLCNFSVLIASRCSRHALLSQLPLRGRQFQLVRETLQLRRGPALFTRPLPPRTEATRLRQRYKVARE
jgi:hypothetical protein